MHAAVSPSAFPAHRTRENWVDTIVSKDAEIAFKARSLLLGSSYVPGAFPGLCSRPLPCSDSCFVQLRQLLSFTQPARHTWAHRLEYRF